MFLYSFTSFTGLDLQQSKPEARVAGKTLRQQEETLSGISHNIKKLNRKNTNPILFLYWILISYLKKDSTKAWNIQDI